MKNRSYLILFLVAVSSQLHAQENYRTANRKDSVKTYHGGKRYPVASFPQKFRAKKPRNIILLIGDGMGVSQIFAGLTANHGHLFLQNFKHVGFSKTQSTDAYITDSAAGATALSTGAKSYNGAIGVTVNARGDTIPVETILEMAEARGLSTGLVSTSAITHATPASFIAHQPSRNMYEAIASDFLATDIDVFIGGGYDHFARRKDGSDLTETLREKGYQVMCDMDQIAGVGSGKLAGLTAPEHNGMARERNGMLVRATQTAITILSQNKKGFFLMAEGSQIDWGSHQNNTIYTVEEMLDFDQVIGNVLAFAAADGQTLVLVTADHETGGLSLVDGDVKSGTVKGSYSTSWHTAVMVPVFAYGPGAENFTGIMENTDIGKKMMALFGF